MTTTSTLCVIPPDVMNRTKALVREHFRSEMNIDAPPDVFERALNVWLDQKVDLVLEEMPELLTRPGSNELRDLARLVRAEQSHSAAEQPAEQAVPAAAAAEHPSFSGYREFSPNRVAAMMAYLAEKSSDIYKTKMNKLLFYADFTAYYLTGQGLSGARYVNLPFGPVPDKFNELLNAGADTGTITLTPVPDKGPGVLRISPGPNAAESYGRLTETDRRVLDWVAETYGHLSTADITELSHAESAYKNTRPNEPISYRYADLLKTLPPRDL